MFKKVLTFTLALALSLGAYAQEKMYLIKGNEVVAKYNVGDVDYATFHLPEGVIDNTGDGPTVNKKQYVSAIGKYYGTTDDVADYQIQFSSRPVMDENIPIDLLYLQFMAPAADYHNLSLPEGTYTIQNGDTRAPFTFYAGFSKVTPEGEEVGGSMVVDRPLPSETNYNIVTGGTFTIAKADGGYTIIGLLRLEDGNVLDFSYTGPCVVENESDEKDPADFLPLPESALTADFALAEVAEAYYGNYGQLFQDKPGYTYHYIYLYDSSYANVIEMGLLVNDNKADGVIIPKGKYQVVKVATPAYKADNNFALAAFKVMGDQTIGQYGCWLTVDYAEVDPLVDGEVEILDDFTGTGNLNIKVSLKDNAATPHNVTATYNGRAEKL